MMGGMKKKKDMTLHLENCRFKNNNLFLLCIFVNDVKQNDIKIKFNHKLNIKLNI